MLNESTLLNQQFVTELVVQKLFKSSYDYSMNENNPTQFQPIEPPSPTNPVSPPVYLPASQTVPPLVVNPNPIIEPRTVTPDPPIKNRMSKKMKIFLILSGVLVLSLVGLISYLLFFKSKPAEDQTASQVGFNWPGQAGNTSPTPVATASDEPISAPQKCSSPLAPPEMTDQYYVCQFRSKLASIAEAQSVYQRTAPVSGTVVQLPDDLIVGKEVYKNITIEWTKNQPLTTSDISSLKSFIDKAPPYFLQYPPVAIISASMDSDFSSQKVILTPNIAAFASGLNMYVTKAFINGKDGYYTTDSKRTFLHEWVHVMQAYNVLQTYKEDSIKTGSIIASMNPFVKNYAKAVGWVFRYDEDRTSFSADLGNDANSQKITDYGKSNYTEDMAESGSFFVSCQDDMISETRIKWWETTTGTNRSTYCPPKI